jgi:hypothetical protein
LLSPYSFITGVAFTKEVVFAISLDTGLDILTSVGVLTKLTPTDCVLPEEKF